MPQMYRDETNRLRDKYYPIEIDPHMTVAEKLPYVRKLDNRWDGVVWGTTSLDEGMLSVVLPSIEMTSLCTNIA